MLKCVCDLCGKDAPETSFIVPWWEEIYATSCGKKVASLPPQLITAKINMCEEHQKVMATVIRAFQQEEKSNETLD